MGSTEDDSVIESSFIRHLCGVGLSLSVMDIFSANATLQLEFIDPPRESRITDAILTTRIVFDEGSCQKNSLY